MAKKKKIKLRGGPYDGETLLISVDAQVTMVFKSGSYHGYYTQSGAWCDVR